MSSSTEFSPLGIKLSYLAQFIQECGGDESIKNKTTLQIRDQFIIPLTIKTGVSLCEQLKYSNSGVYISESSWFVCHSWDSKFLETVNILKFTLSRIHGEEASQDLVIWFDLFSACQHLTSLRPPDWWTKVLMKGIEAIGHLIVVMTPSLHNPNVFHHTNCLFEIFCAHHTKCQLEVGLTSADNELFQTILSQNKEDYYHMLSKIDSQSSVMRIHEDKENIFTALEKLLPRLNAKNLYKTVNSIVFRALEEWMIEVVKAAIRDSVNDERASIQWCMSLKQIFETHGHDEIEEQIYIAEQVLSVSQRIYGDSDPDTLSLMNNLALNYLHQGRADKAEKSLTVCLMLCRSALGPEDETTVETLDNLGLVLLTQKKYKQAEPLHLECFNLKSKLFGMDDVETISSLQNLAGVYTGLKKYELAERLYTDCLNKHTRINGALHSDTNTCRILLASLYTKTKQYPLAEKLYIESCEVHKKKYGFDHHETLACVETLANFYCKIEKFDVAEVLYADIMEAGKRLLGQDCPEEFMAANYQSQQSIASSCHRISTASQISGIFNSTNSVAPTSSKQVKNKSVGVAEDILYGDAIFSQPELPSQIVLKSLSQTSTAENTQTTSPPTTPTAKLSGIIRDSSTSSSVIKEDSPANHSSTPSGKFVSSGSSKNSPSLSNKLSITGSPVQSHSSHPRTVSQESIKEVASGLGLSDLVSPIINPRVSTTTATVGSANADMFNNLVQSANTGPIGRISMPSTPSRVSTGSVSNVGAAGVAPEESLISSIPNSPIPSTKSLSGPLQPPLASSPQKLLTYIAPSKSPVLNQSAPTVGSQTDRTDESTGDATEGTTTEVIELLSVVSGQLSSIAKHRTAKEARAMVGDVSTKIPSLIEEIDGEDSDYDEDEDCALEARLMNDDEDNPGSDQGRDGSLEKRRSDAWDPDSKSSLRGIGI